MWGFCHLHYLQFLPGYLEAITLESLAIYFQLAYGSIILSFLGWDGMGLARRPASIKDINLSMGISI